MPTQYHRRFELGLRFNHADDVIFAHGHVFLTVHLEGLTGIFAEQHTVTNLDAHGLQFAVVADLALAHGDDLTLIGLFGSGIGDHNPGSGLAFFFHAFDDHAVVQRANFHTEVSKNKGLKNVEAEFSTLCLRVPTIGVTLPDFKGRVEVYFYGCVRTRLSPEERRN